MATAAARPRSKVRADDFFFYGMAAVSVIAVLVGFARTYFLAGLFRAPLPNRLIHIHGAVFTLWIVLFATQVALVSVRKIALHRRIGLYGFGLAAFMVILGVLAASDRLARGSGESPDAAPEQVRAFYAIGIGGMLMFATFASLGYRYRNNPAVHKRLMLFATFALLDAAFDRWPIFDPYPLALVNLMCFGPLVLATMAYDWWSTGKVLKTTIWSTVFLFGVQEGRHVVGNWATWQRLAAWVQMHMPPFH
ncbi:MAG TPA: hypothetical protein VIW68_06460 [Candidatus Sulfotelmatobacter sp.]